MSIGRGVILAVAFQKVDAAPHAKAAAQGDDQGLQYVDGTVEELHKSYFLSFCRIVVGFVCQVFCAQFVHIERLVRLHDGRSALHVPFYVKDVLLVGVGQVFVAGVLCQVILIAEKRAHAPKLQDTLAAAHDCNFVLGHQLFATMSSGKFKKGQALSKKAVFHSACPFLIHVFCLALFETQNYNILDGGAKWII